MDEKIKSNDEVTSSVDVKTHHLLVTVASRKWMLLLISVLIFVSSVYILKYKLVAYSSTVSFTVNDIPIAETDNANSPNGGFNQSVGFNLVRQLILSDDMMDHLMKKFNTYDLYQIDTTKEFHNERIIRNLRERITIMKDPFDLISVTYYDVHRYHAAQIANEIASFLDTLRQKQILDKLRKKVEISDLIFNDLRSEQNRQTINFDSLLNRINLLITKADRTEIGKKLIDFEQQLYVDKNNLANSAKDLLLTKKANEWTLQSLNKKNFSTIFVIRKALPDSTSNTLKACLFGVAFVLIFWTFLLVILYCLKRYRNYMKLFIK